jgi:hypothetical protein
VTIIIKRQLAGSYRACASQGLLEEEYKKNSLKLDDYRKHFMPINVVDCSIFTFKL